MEVFNAFFITVPTGFSFRWLIEKYTLSGDCVGAPFSVRLL